MAGHRVDWSDVTILDQHENLHIRLSLEACHIRKQPLPLNRDKASLPPAYDHLLKSSIVLPFLCDVFVFKLALGFLLFYALIVTEASV